MPPVIHPLTGMIAMLTIATFWLSSGGIILEVRSFSVSKDHKPRLTRRVRIIGFTAVFAFALNGHAASKTIAVPRRHLA